MGGNNRQYSMEVASVVLRNWFVGGIFLAAIIGFFTTLLNKPLQLLWMILLTGIVAGIFYIVYRFVLRNQPSYQEYRSYQKAVRVSRKRHHLTVTTTTNSQRALKRPVRRHAPHLTVIEGKKNKKKDRAIF